MNDKLLVETYKRLNSTYKVAKELGISRDKVKRRLKELGELNTQSQAAKNRSTSNFSYVRTEQHRKNLSEIAKSRIGNKNPFFGKKHSEDTKEKLSEYAKQRTADRNPNYKNGSYQRRPRDFKISEFTPIRNFVFNRDDYTCKYCGCIGGHMHAHHTIPYWVKPEAFLDTMNLITVCTKCHFEKAHKKNWHHFDVEIIDERLYKKYSLCRERLNELAGNKPDAIVRSPTIQEIGESCRNDKTVKEE